MKRIDVGAWSKRGGLVQLGFAAGICGLLTLGAVGKEPTQKAEPPTFTKDVAPILQAKCQSCHRRGQVGPFALETYEQARKRADDIAGVVEDHLMPPWKPAPGVGPKLQHDLSLTPDQIKVLQAWAEAGAPRGEAGHMPPPRQFAEGWPLGPPDLVLEMAEDFSVPASGPDLYRCFVLPTELTEDRYITAVDYQPGNRRVVHHMMAFLDVQGGGRTRDAAEPGPGYSSYAGAGVDVVGELGGWAAGNVPHHLPEGVGLPAPRRVDVILQIHYHPSGKPETDRTRVGIYLAHKPVKRAFHWANASNYDFRLPPGRSDTEVKASWFVPVDVEALAVTPHMHQLGREFHMMVTDPKGQTRDLIHISNWDPSWQNTYYFEKPVSICKGSVVKVVARYDNTDNPRNPHQPPKLVKYGQEVTDEMCIGYIGVVKKGQDLTKPGEKDDLFETLARQFQRNARRGTLVKRSR
jgi:Copper type II ascorbate-dependent monooxygenase, C-terminal domain